MITVMGDDLYISAPVGEIAETARGAGEIEIVAAEDLYVSIASRELYVLTE